MRTLLTILTALLFVACESKPRGPVALERDDTCASCRMLISERRYAAELVNRDGEVYKFDDIACMLRFAHSRGIQASETKFYVTDYTSGNDWIDSTQSHFARINSSVSSPMASGIVAFRDSGRAPGQKEALLTFNELWATDVSEAARSATEKKP